MMKQLRLMMLMLLCAVVGTTWAEEVAYKTLTFSSETNGKAVSSYTQSWTATIDGFTWNLANFNNNNNGWDYVKCGRKNYASTATITTASEIDQAISKVVVNVTATKNNDGTKLEVATDEDFTENLQEISVTLTTGNNTFTIPNPAQNCYYRLSFSQENGTSNGDTSVKSVTYYTNSSKQNANLAFSEQTAIAILGETFVAPTLTKDTDASATYSSSNEDVATVDANSGAVTIIGKGNTIITATTEENSNYLSGTASYTLSVRGADDPIFYESFTETEGTGGRDNVFTGSIANATVKTDEIWASATFNKCGGGDNCLKLGTSSDPGVAETGSISLTGNGTLTFQAAGWATGTNTLTVSATGGTLSGDTEITLTNGEWTDYTINITGAEGNLVLTFTGKRGFIDDITIVEGTATDEVSVIINHMYATYSNGEKALDLSQLPEGLTAYKVTELTKDYTVIEEISEPVPANTGLLFKGAEIGEYKIPAYAGNATAPADNILLATSAIQEGSLVEGAPSVWALGVRATDAKVGFMQVTEGTSIAKGNKAYIINNDITEYNEAAVAAFLLYNEETPAETTALDSVKVQVVDGNAPMYNLAGQRVGRDYRGIVIQNGKKFIK